MDSFEWNKIFGAVLGTALLIVGLNIVIGKWMAPHHADKPGMAVEVAETTEPGPVVAEVAPDWGTVIPAADPAAGEKVFSRCVTCHDFTKGGPNKIGPNLYGVVGAKHAQTTSFSYSPAMTALADKAWGYDELDAFLKGPKTAVPGTKMTFNGLSKQQDRINIIAFLRSKSDSPLALPAPKPAAPPAAPADGAAEPAGEVQAPPPGTAPAAPGGATPAAPAAGTPAPAPAQPAPAAGGGH